MQRNGRDGRLALLAGRQAGCVSYSQALELGYPGSTIDRRVATGAWERLHPGVYCTGGAPAGRGRDLWSSVLAVGEPCAITHESAAILHGAERLPEDPITLTNPHRWHHRLPLVFVHQIDDLAPAHQTTIQGLPVSTAARAVVELGATQPPPVVGRVLDDLVHLRRTTYGAVSAVLAQVARPGKPGVTSVAALLLERQDGYVPPASELERMLFATLEAGGLPRPERQVPLPGRGIVGIVDAAYRDVQVLIEADGRRWHVRKDAARRDRERDAQAVRAGWVPLRFVWEQVRDDPAGVCATVAETRAVRLRQLGRAAA